MKSILLFCILLLTCFQSFSQKKIAHKVYLYGNIEKAIGAGKTAIVFEDADAKMELYIIKTLSHEKIPAVSWQSLFIPGSKFTQTESDSILRMNDISSILIFSITGRSSANYSSSNTNVSASAYATANNIYTSGTSNTTGQSFNYTTAMGLKLQVYSFRNKFTNPLGVIEGEAEGSWGIASTTRGILEKIIDRMMSGMKSDNAFVK